MYGSEVHNFRFNDAPRGGYRLWLETRFAGAQMPTCTCRLGKSRLASNVDKYNSKEIKYFRVSNFPSIRFLMIISWMQVIKKLSIPVIRL